MAPSARGSMLSTLGALYALVVVVVGLALPLSVFLPGAGARAALPLLIFHIIINSFSIIFLWYLYTYMRIFKYQYYKRKGREERSLRELHQGNPQSQAVVLASGNDPEVKVINEASHSNDNSLVPTNGGLQILDPNSADSCPFSFTAEGVNFFLRLGAIGFGMASIALDCFQLSQFTSEKVWNCLGTVYLVSTVIRLVNTFMQTHFIFKHHQVVINFHQFWVKFGLLHMVAVNLVIWVTIVALESASSFIHHETSTTDDVTHGYANESSQGTHVTPAGHHVIRRAADSGHGMDDVHVEEISLVECLESSETLSSAASPYLFPCAIEFSLISAAIIYRIFSNVGRQINLETKRREAFANSIVQAISGDCQKANSGLFIGLLMFTCVLVSLFFYIYIDTVGGNEVARTSSVLIFFISDHTVHILSLTAVCVGFYKVSKLHFSRKLESSFDQNLVVIALVGHFLLSIFILIASVKTLMSGEFRDTTEQNVILQVSLSILTLFQSAIQVLFIIDALHRRSSDSSHFRLKPGRAVVTFLILCNLAMWMTSTFELKGVYKSPTHIDYYGALAWNLIVHLFLPLSIFYRFHSAICLAEIWLVAYRVDAEHIMARQEQQRVNHDSTMADSTKL